MDNLLDALLDAISNLPEPPKTKLKAVKITPEIHKILIDSSPNLNTSVGNLYQRFTGIPVIIDKDAEYPFTPVYNDDNENVWAPELGHYPEWVTHDTQFM